MAFQNYLSESLYTVIDDVSYEKNNKAVSFSLNVYSDSTKQVLLAKNDHRIGFHQYAEELEDVNCTFPPFDLPAEEVKYGLASSDCEAVWHGYDGYIAMYDFNVQLFTFKKTHPLIPYYSKADQKFYKKESDESTWVEIKYPPCTLVWDMLFSVSAISKPGTNLHKQVYLWLKSQPGFENVVDV